MSVYTLDSTIEDDRPEINWSAVGNVGVYADELWEMFRDVNAPVPSEPVARFIVDSDCFADWDCYACPGYSPLFSARFVEGLGKVAFSNSKVVQAKIRDQDFFFLAAAVRSPVLDFERSECEWSEQEGTRNLIGIDKHVFVESMIPESHLFYGDQMGISILVAEPLKRKIESLGLKGISFEVCR